MAFSKRLAAGDLVLYLYPTREAKGFLCSLKRFNPDAPNEFENVHNIPSFWLWAGDVDSLKANQRVMCRALPEQVASNGHKV